ncbi:hypothetical protein CPB86DRAFT_180116 [Serendipita vermifera]|nr:hypothetical protein CPB86DRAFT_180116 [Serendipita vermifera]
MAEINKSDRSPLNGSLTFPLNQPTFPSSGAPLNHQFSGVYEAPIGSSLLVNHNGLPETRGLEVEAHYAHHIHASTSRHTAYGAHSNRIAAIDWVASTPPIISAVDPTLATSENVFPSAFPTTAVALPLQKLPAPLFWEAKTFLEALRHSWRSNNLVSFSQADADQLQTLLNRFKGCEKRKIKSLLRYSGNKVEFVQTAIQELSERLKHKKGFVGHYHAHDSRHPTQLLQDYLVVRLSGTTKYMSSSCGRFNSGSSCTHCSNDMNHSTNPGKCWRTWQHVMICLSASLQGHRNIWACFESGW